VRFLLGLIVLVAQALTSAPGDRYFGRMSMSTLRIRYETMQLKKRYETHQLLPQDAEHLLILTDDAFQEWARDYPHDPWLPSTGYSIARLYEELPGTHASERAVALLVYVKLHFPTSRYARLSRDQLHRGVRTRPYPSWAVTPPPALPTAAPSVTPTSVSPATPAPSPSPTKGSRSIRPIAR
jgi:hypothetical protein